MAVRARTNLQQKKPTKGGVLKRRRSIGKENDENPDPPHGLVPSKEISPDTNQRGYVRWDVKLTVPRFPAQQSACRTCARRLPISTYFSPAPESVTNGHARP